MTGGIEGINRGIDGVNTNQGGSHCGSGIVAERRHKIEAETRYLSVKVRRFLFDQSGLVVGVLASGLLAAVVCGCGGATKGADTSIGANSMGTITTVAGTGSFGYTGDGGSATQAELYQPTCAVLDSAGNIYIGDVTTNTVRKVAAGTEIISLYAGTHAPPFPADAPGGYSGDGGLAISAKMYGPTACALDTSGNLYVADVANNVIRKITASTGIITTVVGNGYAAGTSSGGFSGDGGLGTQAELNHPRGVLVDPAGDIFISDTGNQRVREVNGSTGMITTIAGNGTYGNSGNGGQGIAAMIAAPHQLAIDAAGNLYIANYADNIISKVNLSTGIITTVAGNGTMGDGYKVSGDGGLATQAQLAGPQGVVVDSAGNIYISDAGNQRVRKVTASTGIITTVVGTTVGYTGDGGPAAVAQLHNPEGLFIDAAGNLYIADAYNGVVRKVTP